MTYTTLDEALRDKLRMLKLELEEQRAVLAMTQEFPSPHEERIRELLEKIHQYELLLK